MVYQFRCGGRYANITQTQLKDGSFINGFNNIYALGIQAPPGTSFSINRSSSIFIGSTGIYELDLRYVKKAINAIQFDQMPEGDILIDIAYYNEEG